MEDPARAGLTKTGKPSWSTRLRTVSGSLRHCRSVTAMYGPTPEPGGFEDHLHEVLVHADGGRQHAGAHVAGVGQLQEALDGAVLAERAVQQREHHVHGAEFLRDLVRGGHDQLVFAADFGQRHGLGRGRDLGQGGRRERPVLRVAGGQHPLAGLGDPDRDDLVLRLVDGAEDPGRGHAADRVFAGTAAEQHRHAGPCRAAAPVCVHVFFRHAQ